jgi:hypothetical protein
VGDVGTGLQTCPQAAGKGNRNDFDAEDAEVKERAQRRNNLELGVLCVFASLR